MQPGTLKNTIKTLSLIIILNLFASSCLSSWIDLEKRASFKVDGDTATMTGVINSRIVKRVENLIQDHPNVKTIILQNVPGSIDDEMNLIAARLVRKANLTTIVPANGEIASGGVDFFLAGSTRIIEPGAKIGVHSWASEDENGKTIVALELPPEHKDHQSYLDYYRDMGIDEKFYWYTLESAPAESIHWMSPEEIVQYGMATE